MTMSQCHKSIISILILISNEMVGSNNSRSLGDKLLKTLPPIYLSKDYSKLSLPKTNDKEPVNITVIAKNMKIQNIDDRKSTLTLDIRFSFSWVDTRVKLHHNSSKWTLDYFDNSKFSYLSNAWLKKLWIPDLDIVNLHDMRIGKGQEDHRILKAYNDYRFWYEFPAIITIHCPLFDFKSYPFDVQVCVLLVGSFRHPIQENVYMGYLIQNNEKYENTLQYDVENIIALSFASCILTDYHYYLSKDGNMKSQELHHSYFGIKIKVKRSIQIHIAARFLPSILFVSLSWFGFAMGASNINGRLIIQILSILGVLFMR